MPNSLAARIKENSGLRFLTVGGLAFLTEYSVFYVLYIFAHWHLLIANSISFGAGLLISFSLNRGWSFKKGTYQHKAHQQAALYVTLAVTNLAINNISVALLKNAGLDPRIGKIIAIAIIAAWNFIFYRKVIFKEKHLPKSTSST